MLRNLRSRRRPRYGTFLCVVVLTLLLLLFSLSLLDIPIPNHSHHHPRFLRNTRRPSRHHDVNYDTLLSDSVIDDASSGGEDTIDALDVIEDQPPLDDTFEEDDDYPSSSFDPVKVSGFFFYHISGAIRRAFNKRSAVEWKDGSRQVGIFFGSQVVGQDDWSKAALGSDDIPVEESIRKKVIEVKGVEDALLLKVGRRVSPLREGWGDWFDKKSDFLRKDKMLRSNLEGLNPSHNPILQDPDGVGVTGLTKGDKILHKALLNEYKRVPFLGRKIQEPKLPW